MIGALSGNVRLRFNRASDLMTFREVRQFAEIVRTLGYPNAVGIDSFDTPNFALMAELLRWLATLYDPDIVVIPELTHEHGRVEFVRSIVQQLAVRSGIRLNPRKLYTSDRFAVRELLKIAAPIYRGVSTTGADLGAGGSQKPPSAARIAQLSAAVPQRAVELHDQLETELMIREPRARVLATMPPLDEVERAVLGAVESAAVRLETLTKQLDQLNSDEDTLRSKMKQRKHELERQSKRLMSVQTIRPAYMDEYEGIEQELQELFRRHCQQYRNVDFLEHELQKAAEKQKLHNQERDKTVGKLKKRTSEKIIGNIQQSFALVQQSQPGPIGGMESGDEVAAGGIDNDSDNSF
jgi:clusterin-associated protein 1